MDATSLSTLVIAGDRLQFEEFIRQWGIIGEQYDYVSTLEKILGALPETTVVLTGRYYLRGDWYDLQQRMQAANIRPVIMPT
jgi:hypothetical protein